MNILEELYLSYTASVQKSFRHRELYLEAIKKATESEGALIESLNEKQKELFDKYIADQQNLAAITDRETFIQGFKAGAGIMLDVLGTGE